MHILPSGVLRPDKINIIGNNVLVDPVKVLDEIRGLKERGIEVTPEQLKISHKAHLVLEYNRVLDGAKGGKIGTTKRAIGPTYVDKADRIGLRMHELQSLSERTLEDLLQNTRTYVDYISDFLGVRLMGIGVGPKRDQLIRLL